MPGTDTDRDAGADEKPAAAPRAPRRLLCSSFRRGYSRLKRPGLEPEPGSSSLPSFIALWQQLREHARRRLAPISSIGPQEKNLRAISANCTVTQQRSGEPDRIAHTVTSCLPCDEPRRGYLLGGRTLLSGTWADPAKAPNPRASTERKATTTSWPLPALPARSASASPRHRSLPCRRPCIRYRVSRGPCRRRLP